jgi:sensor histidine kinase YesM
MDYVQNAHLWVIHPVYAGVVFTSADVWLPLQASYFVRATSSMIAFYIYFDFGDAFLNIRQRLPSLYRLFSYIKSCLLVYIGFQVVICFVLADWHPAIYEAAFSIIRALLAIAGFYAIYELLKLTDIVSRYFVAGTLFIQVGSLISQAFSLIKPVDDLTGPFWTISLAYLQLGIILELICFSLGLSYGQRQIAIRHAIMEQELAREREQRRREHLEAELSVQRLEQENTEVHIRALQVQVNPHFLFNSLNVLDSLIDDDPAQARVFLEN